VTGVHIFLLSAFNVYCFNSVSAYEFHLPLPL
jgi:hypothetical protein